MILGTELGGSEIHEMTIRPCEIGGDVSRASADLVQPVVSQPTGAASTQVRRTILIFS